MTVDEIQYEYEVESVRISERRSERDNSSIFSIATFSIPEKQRNERAKQLEKLTQYHSSVDIRMGYAHSRCHLSQRSLSYEASRFGFPGMSSLIKKVQMKSANPVAVRISEGTRPRDNIVELDEMNIRKSIGEEKFHELSHILLSSGEICCRVVDLTEHFT